MMMATFGVADFTRVLAKVIMGLASSACRLRDEYTYGWSGSIRLLATALHSNGVEFVVAIGAAAAQAVLTSHPATTETWSCTMSWVTLAPAVLTSAASSRTVT